MGFLRSVQCFSKLMDPKERVMGTSDYRSELQVRTWTCDWHLKSSGRGQSCTIGPLPVGFDAVSR